MLPLRLQLETRSCLDALWVRPMSFRVPSLRQHAVLVGVDQELLSDIALKRKSELSIYYKSRTEDVVEVLMSVREHSQCGVRQGRRSIDRRRYKGRQLVLSAIETLGKETRTSSERPTSSERHAALTMHIGEPSSSFLLQSQKSSTPFNCHLHWRCRVLSYQQKIDTVK